MRNVATGFLTAAVLASMVIAVDTQERAGNAATSDPRVGLKGGLRDAGVAARNMELLANLPKPDGFFDPDGPGWCGERARAAACGRGRTVRPHRQSAGGRCR